MRTPRILLTLVAVTAFSAMTVLSTSQTVSAACGGAFQPNCPSVPTLTATAAPEAVNLTWGQSTNVYTTHYNLRRGATTIVYSGGATTYKDTERPAGEEQSYFVQACSNESNGCSAFSSVSSATPTEPDTPEPPVTDWLTSEQVEYQLARFTGIWVALLAGIGIIISFRFRT